MTQTRAFALAACLALSPALAQPASFPTPGFRLFDRLNATFSSTGDSHLSVGGGDVSVQRFEFEAHGRWALSAASTLVPGLGIVRTELDAPAGSGLPDTLQEVSARLGWLYQRDATWRFTALIRPGFFGDRSRLDTDTFNVPFLGLASYGRSRALVWSFGVIANAFGDNPVLPVAGVRWQYAPAWTLNIGYPRAGIEWAASEATTVTAGATFQGGAYRVTRDHAAGIPGLRSVTDSEFDYREIRLGVGASFDLSSRLVLTLDAGVAIDQRFEYHERGLEQKGDEAPFAAIAFTGRF